jgi:hypothetical protein
MRFSTLGFFSSINPTYKTLIHGLKPFRMWLDIASKVVKIGFSGVIDPVETEN